MCRHRVQGIFHSWRTRKAISTQQSTLSLYQGELLPGFYEDWIVLERERIRGMFDIKMEQLIGQLIAAERWLSLGNPLELTYRALMLAYGARGDMAMAPIAFIS